jgi:hypothetical protein
VVVKASKKELTGKDIVKKAVASIPSNYPMKPFMIEGFFRDLQNENDKPVELLEAALKFRYKDYNPGYEDVEIIEVRRSINKRHPSTAHMTGITPYLILWRTITSSIVSVL